MSGTNRHFNSLRDIGGVNIEVQRMDIGGDVVKVMLFAPGTYL